MSLTEGYDAVETLPAYGKNESFRVCVQIWTFGGTAEGCSGRQGHNPAGESPAAPIARFRRVAIPQFRNGNILSIARCKWPGCPAALVTAKESAGIRLQARERKLLGARRERITGNKDAAVGAIGGSSKCGSLNISE